MHASNIRRPGSYHYPADRPVLEETLICNGLTLFVWRRESLYAGTLFPGRVPEYGAFRHTDADAVALAFFPSGTYAKVDAEGIPGTLAGVKKITR